MFNKSIIKELVKEIKTLEYKNTELELELFKLKYPNGILKFEGSSIFKDLIFLYEPMNGLTLLKGVLPIDDTSDLVSIKRIDDKRFLINWHGGQYCGKDEAYAIFDTSTNQSIRVDKDMKVVL